VSGTVGSHKALFLDRDGVINVERGYVHRREDFHFQEGIFDLCRAAQRLGFRVVVVTNQAGIGRGYYTESMFLELTRWMIHEFACRHVRIAGLYYCPAHPDHGLGVLVGDRVSDIAAARAAGVGTRILLRSDEWWTDLPETECLVAESLHDIRHRFFSPVLAESIP
jgi:D-glycero-D-manno-heptose 1,7-bisphosphate phosphatase